MVTKQQLTCSGTLITWQSRSQQHEGKRLEITRKKGSFLGLSERTMENRPRATVKSSLMMWRREPLKKGAHEHFRNHTLYFEQLLSFRYLCCFSQCWQKYLREWRSGCSLSPGVEDDDFLPMERDLGQWRRSCRDSPSRAGEPSAESLAAHSNWRHSQGLQVWNWHKD